MPRRKGLLEKVFVDAPQQAVTGTIDLLYGSDEPAPRRRKLQRCPVCGGRGEVPSGFYDGIPKTNTHEMCRTCGGRGIV